MVIEVLRGFLNIILGVRIEVKENCDEDKLQDDNAVADPAMKIVVLMVGVLVDVGERPEKDMQHQVQKEERCINLKTVIHIIILKLGHPTVRQHQNDQCHKTFGYHVQDCAEDIKNDHAHSVSCVSPVEG